MSSVEKPRVEQPRVEKLGSTGSTASHRTPSLPVEPGYTDLLGIPKEVVERLRSLHQSALDGALSLEAWHTRHAEMLAEHRGDLDPAELDRLVAQVRAAACAASDDFDRWLFLSTLETDLHLLQVPDPVRELHQLETAMPTLTAGQTRWQAERRLDTLRALAGRRPPEVYEPGSRMIKALRVGTLEETNRWLQATVARNPRASVQDLLTWAAVEVAEAKLELDRYDALKDHRDERTAP